MRHEGSITHHHHISAETRLLFDSRRGRWTCPIPYLQLPEPSFTRGFTDKIYHVVGGMILVLLAAMAWRVPAWALSLAVPLSFVIEIVQGMAPGRSVHLADMIANVSGVALALVLLAIGLRRGKLAAKGTS